jgi:two-component system NtrC family sensor kinase
VDKYALDKIVVRRNGLGETGNIYLVDKDKLLITECRSKNDGSLRHTIDTTGVRDCLSGNSGIGIYNGCCINIPVVGAYTWLEEPGWALLTEMDTKEAFAPSRKILNLIIIVTIPVFLIVIGISLIVSRRISRPIITITDAVKDITAGDLERKATVLADDEFGEISNELDKIVSEIQESYKKLLHSEKLASVGHIAAGVAHEINNPLSVLSGRLQLLIENCTDNALSEEYKKLLRLSNRIAKIVDGLLYFSRQKDMELTTADINTVIEDSISLLDEQMIAQGIRIDKRYGVNLPPVEVSVDQIQQVFVNIIMNAFDSMIENGILAIRTELSDDSKNIQIVFEDTGSGIAAKDINKIFEPFFTTKPPHQGTGLGLSISYGIIENHKGTIKVESREGKGSIFTVSLPCS